MQTPRWHERKGEVLEGRELLPLELPMPSLAERDRRWAAVREKMYFRGLGSLVLVGTDFNSSMGMANVRYLTQVGSIVGAYAIFPASGEPVVFSGAPHMHMPTGAYRHIPGHWVDDVRPKAGVAGIAQWLRERGLDRGRIGAVGYSDLLSPVSNLAAGFLDELRRLLPEAQISDETPLLEEARLIKSEEERELLRAAGRIARKRIERLIATAKPGVSEAEVWAAMEHEAVINGAEPITFNLLSSGPVGGGAANGALRNLLHGSEVPNSPSMRTLAEGDIVLCEFHTCYGGYLAATEFSVFLGEAPSQLVRLHETAAEIVRMAAEVMVADMPLRHAYSAFHSHVERAGLDFLELGFHGHGLASPEFPAVVYREADLGQIGRAGIGDMRFREGMVFGLNIDIHDPSWRRDVGVMLGDMVALGPGGTEYMCEIPLEVFELR
jgi:Xaa-Pro aminopeptidase